ncbi:hypothetical protein NR798_03245 [Archangium gephyra]|uniref:hypothetical protein n=1 Tax=Archangium gephyra TaxID=48 RepID=UPI0035D3E02F
MNKLMPLFAVAVTACGPALHDEELRDIPGLGLYVPFSYSRTADTMSVALSYDWERGGDCYRIPADTRLTLNGEAATLDRRGDARLGFDGASSCEYPAFKGAPRPADEPRTEVVLSDGRSSMRAVFQSLHAPRRFRVNGQEQPMLHSGEAIDIEWLPATDQLEMVDMSLLEDGTAFVWIHNPDIEVNHVRFKLPGLNAGSYVLRVTSRGTTGVEACEGFSSCHAGFEEQIEVPFVIE